MTTFRQAAIRLNRNGTDVRILMLLRGIPFERVGRAYAMDDEAFEQLRLAFEETDRLAAEHGMTVAVG